MTAGRATSSSHSCNVIAMSENESQAIMKHLVSTKAENLAWIFSDKAGLRQRLLQELGIRTVHFHHDLHSRSQCQSLLNELALQCPSLLWIRFAGPCAGSGNRHDALRAEHLVRVLNQQKAEQRLVVVEASERSQVWNLQAVKECMSSLLSTVHQWCNYESGSTNSLQPCCSRIRLLTNFQVPDGRKCNCKESINHVSQKELGPRATARFEHVLRKLIHMVCGSEHILRAPELLQMPTKGQPESLVVDDVNLDKHGAKPLILPC